MLFQVTSFWSSFSLLLSFGSGQHSVECQICFMLIATVTINALHDGFNKTVST